VDKELCAEGVKSTVAGKAIRMWRLAGNGERADTEFAPYSSEGKTEDTYCGLKKKEIWRD
jgi:hypothetical protein